MHALMFKWQKRESAFCQMWSLVVVEVLAESFYPLRKTCGQARHTCGEWFLSCVCGDWGVQTPLQMACLSSLVAPRRISIFDSHSIHSELGWGTGEPRVALLWVPISSLPTSFTRWRFACCLKVQLDLHLQV